MFLLKTGNDALWHCLIWDVIDYTLMLTELFFFFLWLFHLQNLHKVTQISTATFIDM